MLIAGAGWLGCGDDGTDDNDSSSGTSSSSTTSNAGGAGGGTGGMTSTGTGTGTGTGGAGGSGGSPPVVNCATGADHLLISEIGLGDSTAEFIEIWNPGAAAVNLDGYYLSDESIYYKMALGDAWAPRTKNTGTDHLTTFPKGTSIGPDQVLVIQTGTDFFGEFKTCPDFILAGADQMCDSKPIAKMVAPANIGGTGSKLGGMVSNAGEMLMLFCWDGVSTTVKDVDYVTWDPDYDTPDTTHVVKTGVAGYQDDTAAMSQMFVKPPKVPQKGVASIGRCNDTESGEKTMNGNGSVGHDETSEDFTTTFKVQSPPSPGAKNAACK